jgi:hypothetical protein
MANLAKESIRIGANEGIFDIPPILLSNASIFLRQEYDIVGKKTVDAVNKGIKKFDNEFNQISLVEFTENGLKIIFKKTIYPEILIFGSEKSYRVISESKDIWKKETGVNFVIMNISQDMHYSITAFNSDGVAARHANVTSGGGNVCLGELGNHNSIRKSNINELISLLGIQNYTSPHNSDLGYIFDSKGCDISGNVSVANLTGKGIIKIYGGINAQ